MDYVTPILTSAITIFLYLIGKSYFPKYFETKALNRANLEDTPAITKIIESIKTELLQQTEILKASISFANQHKINVLNAEREALIDYNRKITARIYYSVRLRLGDYDENSISLLDDIFKETGRRLYDCDMADAHLTLFVQDTEFVKMMTDLIIEITNLESTNSKHIIGYKSKCQQYLTSQKYQNPDSLALLKKFQADTFDIFFQQQTAMLEHFRKIAPLHNAIKADIKRRLINLETTIESVQLEENSSVMSRLNLHVEDNSPTQGSTGGSDNKSAASDRNAAQGVAELEK